MIKEPTTTLLLRQAADAVNTQDRTLDTIRGMLAAHAANRVYFTARRAALLAALMDNERAWDTEVASHENAVATQFDRLDVCDAQYAAAAAMHNAIPGEMYVPNP